MDRCPQPRILASDGAILVAFNGHRTSPAIIGVDFRVHPEIRILERA